MIFGALHDLARDRGDGLRPELRQLLARLERPAGAGDNVTELPTAGGRGISGPQAAIADDSELPANVVRFDLARRDGEDNKRSHR